MWCCQLHVGYWLVWDRYVLWVVVGPSSGRCSSSSSSSKLIVVSAVKVVSHKIGGRLQLLSVRPAVIFPAAEHRRPLTSTKMILLGVSLITLSQNTSVTSRLLRFSLLADIVRLINSYIIITSRTGWQTHLVAVNMVIFGIIYCIFLP